MLFFRRGWYKLANFKYLIKTPITKVSILVAARNEEDKIKFTIEDILAQNYPKELYELIIVDDHSTDSTAQIISSYKNQGVKLIQLNESQLLNSYKKKAITEAINFSTGELIITTDADCRMASNWLDTIVNYYEQYDFNLISSPVIFYQEKSLFERLQTLEFLSLIGIGAAGIGNRMPSTCNGANLAYKKSVFLDLGGFKGIDDLASGDDELFLHKVANVYPNTIGFCKSNDAMVYTYAKPNLKEFLQQRKRWASKSVKYKEKKIIFLAIVVWVFNLSFVLNMVLAFFYPVVLKFLICQFAIKFLSELVYMKPLTNFVKRKDLVFLIPIATVLQIFYIIYIGLAGNSGKYQWKGRMVK